MSMSETFLKHVLAFFGTDLLSLRRRYRTNNREKATYSAAALRSVYLSPLQYAATHWQTNVHRLGSFIQDCCTPRSYPLYDQSSASALYVTGLYSPSFTHSQIRHARLIELEYLEVHRQLLSGQAQKCSGKNAVVTQVMVS